MIEVSIRTIERLIECRARCTECIELQNDKSCIKIDGERDDDVQEAINMLINCLNNCKHL